MIAVDHYFKINRYLNNNRYFTDSKGGRSAISNSNTGFCVDMVVVDGLVAQVSRNLVYWEFDENGKIEY